MDTIGGSAGKDRQDRFIELPPPIPEKKKPSPKTERIPVRQERVKTERIPVREERVKTERIAVAPIERRVEPPPIQITQDPPRRSPFIPQHVEVPAPKNQSTGCGMAFLAVCGCIVVAFVIIALTGSNSTTPVTPPLQAPTASPEEASKPPQFDPATAVAVEKPSPTADELDKQARAKFDEGWAYGNQGKFAESIASYQEALALKSGFPEAWGNIGWAYSKLGDVPNAITSYRNAVGIKSDFPDAWYGLAICYASTEDAQNTAEALRHLQESNSGLAQQFARSLKSDFVSKIAVALYPSLGVLDSPLNVEFRRRYRYYQANQPGYFANSDWSIVLVRESAQALEGTNGTN